WAPFGHVLEERHPPRLAHPEAVTRTAEGALRGHGAAQSCQPVVVRCPADAVPVHPAIRLNDGLRLDDAPRLRLAALQDGPHHRAGEDDRSLTHRGPPGVR